MSDRREDEGLCARLPADASGRLDALLARLWPGISRRRLKAAFRAGAVRQDGRLVRGHDAPRPGALVTLDLEGAPAPPPLEVCYEDEALICVEKPAGLAAAPSARGGAPCAAAALAERHPELPSVGDIPGAPGLCHRLDRETSGLLLFARTQAAFEAVRGAFARREVEKIYLAVVEGSPAASGACDRPLGRRRGRGRRMVVAGDDAPRGLRRVWPARTEYRVLERAGRRALLEVRIATGVTHQIRAHLAHLGFPVVGDDLYGAPGPRLALHAQRLGLRHPTTGRPLTLESERGGEVRGLLVTCP